MLHLLTCMCADSMYIPGPSFTCVSMEEGLGMRLANEQQQQLASVNAKVLALVQQLSLLTSCENLDEAAYQLQVRVD